MNKNEIILISLSQNVYYKNVNNCEKLQKSKICYFTSLYIYIYIYTYQVLKSLNYIIILSHIQFITQPAGKVGRETHCLYIYVADIGIELMYCFIMILYNMLIHVRNACI